MAFYVYEGLQDREKYITDRIKAVRVSSSFGGGTVGGLMAQRDRDDKLARRREEIVDEARAADFALMVQDLMFKSGEPVDVSDDDKRLPRVLVRVGYGELRKLSAAEAASMKAAKAEETAPAELPAMGDEPKKRGRPRKMSA